MNKGRCLGLVGGLGVGATIHYYQKLARAHEAQGRTMDIVIAHAEVSRVFEYVQAGDRDGLAGYLIRYIDRLMAAGAEFAAILPLRHTTVFESLLQLRRFLCSASSIPWSRNSPPEPFAGYLCLERATLWTQRSTA